MLKLELVLELELELQLQLELELELELVSVVSVAGCEVRAGFVIFAVIAAAPGAGVLGEAGDAGGLDSAVAFVPKSR